MTKDEAVNTILGFNPVTLHQAEAAVDTYVALGMLKLDEPKSIDADLREAITNAIIDNMPSLRGIRSAVEAILNIIEE